MSKKSQRRDCPALDRPITSADCGSGRHSSIRCPATCPHNSLAPATYDQLLALESKLDRATLDRLASELGRPAVEKLCHNLLPDDLTDLQDDSLAINAAVFRAFHFEHDANGRSACDRWLADPSARLSNDERVVLAAKGRLRPTLLEIREVRPDGLLRAADLLAPEEGEFDLLDRAAWARAVRFGVSLVWSYPLPHFRRIFGGGIAWPDWSGLDLDPADALAEIVAHAGGPAVGSPAPERVRWIALNFIEVIRRVFAVSNVRRHDMLAGLDMTHGWAEFALDPTAAKRLHARLKKSPDASPSDPDPTDDVPAGYTSAWDWHEPASVSSPTGAPGRVLIGRVLTRPDGTWRIVAFGRTRLARLRELFCAATGTPDLAPTREYVQDLASQLALKEPSIDASLVPPRLRHNPTRFDFSTTRLDASPEEATRLITTRQLDGWIDLPLPALGNRSPREAVDDPASRAIVARMLRSRIADSDLARLRARPFADPMPTVRALGLAELDRPNPPARPCPPELLDDEDETTHDPASAAPDLAPLPPAAQNLDYTAASRRAEEIYRRFPDDDLLVYAWDIACPGLADTVANHTPEDFTDEQLDDIEFTLALAWAILFGGNTRKLALDLTRIAVAANAGRETRESSLTDTPATARSFLQSILSLQPELIKVLLENIWARAKSRRRDSESLPMAEILHWLGAVLPAYFAALGRDGS